MPKVGLKPNFLYLDLSIIIMTSKDYAITNAMLRYGGSFAHAIATAAEVADDDNLAALKTALPKLWSHYEMMSAISPEQRLADKAIKISLDATKPNHDT